ncbi:MAG: FMN-binding protein [Clostridium sp.]|nr:FMN-binding protein [Prevotella sp.]MCM1429389.1 FMN-binding protein [Clostridium sp.]MCM1475576.1 FMN-binding protein [Muribaculaceae bacterium]
MKKIFGFAASLIVALIIIGTVGTVDTNGQKSKSSPKGTFVINTSRICGSIKGFAGPVPVKIYVSKGKITKVEPLANKETPQYFQKVVGSGLLNKWNGKTLKQAATMKVDAVSGATFSSRALIRNVQEGAKSKL